jgi:hypothetical protein
MAALRSVSAAKMHSYFANCGYPLARSDVSDSEVVVIMAALTTVHAALIAAL